MTRFVQRFRLPLILPLLLLTCAALPGLAAAQTSIDQLPVDETGIPLVARVNDAPITLPAFQRALARRQFDMAAADPLALEAEVLEQLIDQVLIGQAAAAQDITISDEEVQAELQINLELAGSPEDWQAWLSLNGYSEAEFIETLRMTLLTNRVRDLLTADLSGDVTQVHARHILVQTEAEAFDLMARLQAGEDFGALAAQVSLDDTTARLGGDLGWFVREELLVPELADAAFMLSPGQVGGPVRTALGYHIVQTLESGSRPVEPERRVYIAQARFENWLTSVRQVAIIERYL
ncbi:MAG: peptidylprolyl isomerase [Chloroflexi bacterium]|nr:peptidylprolyl isomerase [Chloroflexota bacterium]